MPERGITVHFRRIGVQIKKGRQLPSRGIYRSDVHPTLPMVIVMVAAVCVDYARAKGGGDDKTDDDEFYDVEHFHYSSI